MGDYRKLDVWRKAHALAINVHRDASIIKGSRYAALRSQLIRAAMSIPANIVEGRSQISEREFGRSFATLPTPRRQTAFSYWPAARQSP